MTTRLFEPGEKVQIGGDMPRFRGTVGEIVEFVQIAYYVVRSPLAPNGTIRCNPAELAAVTDTEAIAPDPPRTEPLQRTYAADDDKTRLRRIAREQGYTGDCCGQCGSDKMVMDGRCQKCLSCGTAAGGCS